MATVVEAVHHELCQSNSLPLTITQISTWQSLDHNDEDRSSMSSSASATRFLPSPLRELVLYGRTKGWPALFAGLRPCLAATAISQGVYFYLYSASRQAAVVSTQEGIVVYE